MPRAAETVQEPVTEPAVLRRHPQVAYTTGLGPRTVVIRTRVVLGAAAGVDVMLDEPTVSRLHAELEPREGGLWVTDLGSRNGTFVEGVRVQSACVPDRGRLRLGNLELSVSYGPKPTPVELWPEDRFGPLIGRSPKMRELFVRLARIAPTDSTVLIQGETGTGKEVVARALHESSARAEGPLVIVDCAALPETLLEAELFGHARGAFTGAQTARPGALEAASGGTVFLDEIGELPMSMQPKLLRALESRTIRRLGENEVRRIDVRFVSATHRDLRTMVNARAFREDLYFRLAVVPVVVPPLRDRPEDIEPLARHFLPTGAPPGVLTADLLRKLEAQAWLGNVRELRNVLERVVALGQDEAMLAAAPLPPAATGEAAIVPPEVLALPYKEARERCLELIERTYVQALLARHQHNVTAAAEAAGLNRTYVHRLVRKHGL